MKPLKRERGRGGPTASPSAQKLAAKATTPPKAAKTKKEGTKKKSSVTSPATPRSARAPSGDWTCDNCGHAHRTTRRSAETLAACVRCTCLRGDVLHEFRPQRPSFALSPDPLRRLLVDRPIQTTYPLVVAGDRVDPVRRWLTINPHSFPGSKLYARFHRAFLKSKDKSVSRCCTARREGGASHRAGRPRPEPPRQRRRLVHGGPQLRHLPSHRARGVRLLRRDRIRVERGPDRNHHRARRGRVRDQGKKRDRDARVPTIRQDDDWRGVS